MKAKDGYLFLANYFDDYLWLRTTQLILYFSRFDNNRRENKKTNFKRKEGIS